MMENYLYGLNLFLCIWTLCILPLESSFMPSIYWSPKNPLFRCKDPTINVVISTHLPIVCPHVSLSSIKKGTDTVSTNLYENVQFLGTNKTAFDSCDATGQKTLMTCDAPQDTKPLMTQKLIITKFSSGDDGIEFAEGETYYMISTGFRTVENVNNKVNGSCSKTVDTDDNKIRLKIRVCTKAEVDNGDCPICESEGCYYRDCDLDCSDWTSDGVERATDSSCVQWKKRECTNNLLGDVRIERKNETVPCPTTKPRNCTITQESIVKDVTTGECYKETNNTCGYTTKLKTTCPTTQPLSTDAQIGPTAGGRTGVSNDDGNVYKYVAIAVAIVGLLIGVVFGIFCNKYHHKGNCPNRVGESGLGAQENQGYRVSYFGGDCYVDGQKVSSPTKTSTTPSAIYMQDKSFDTSSVRTDSANNSLRNGAPVIGDDYNLPMITEKSQKMNGNYSPANTSHGDSRTNSLNNETPDGKRKESTTPMINTPINYRQTRGS